MILQRHERRQRCAGSASSSSSTLALGCTFRLVASKLLHADGTSAAFAAEIQERSGALAGAPAAATPAHSSAYPRLAAAPTALSVAAAVAASSSAASSSSAPAPAAAAATAAAPPVKLPKLKARMLGLDLDS